MPTIPPGGKVLVTGANGYIALWVVRKLLEQGYSVRAQVRSEAKARHMKEYFKDYADEIEWVIVEDITAEGAFDEAVKDVDAIAHMASPLSSDTDDPDDYIVPAVQGTLGIVNSALKEPGRIRRIVVTSSVLAILSTVTNPPRTFTEEDWADEFVDTVQKKGKQSTGNEKYRASKTLAERGAWELHERHKSEVSWDIVTLHPSLVLGPPLQEVQSPTHLNASLLVFFNMVFKDQPQAALTNGYGFIHVEDIALAHILALQKEDAGGERIMISAGNETWQGTRNITHKLFPKYYSSGVLPSGKEDERGDVTAFYYGQKAKRLLGLEYKPLDEIVKDTIADFEGRGWLEKKYEA